MEMRFLLIVAGLMVAGVAAADPAPFPVVPSAQAVNVSLRPVPRRVHIPEARWGTSGGRQQWSLAALSALRGPAERLPEIVPEDIATWCPAYPSAGREDREAFWVGLVSSLAKHESTYRPTAVGGGGLWYGLLQILPSTARHYNCQASSGAELKNPKMNLACGLRIMAKTVSRDRVVSRNMRGVAADWGPFHSRAKREDMIAWTRSQPYCAGLPKSLKPVGRPDSWGEPTLFASVDMGDTRPHLPAYDGVIAYAVDGVIVRGGNDPVIATSGKSVAQEIDHRID